MEFHFEGLLRSGRLFSRWSFSNWFSCRCFHYRST